jgi:hypothetical protein
MKPERNTAGNSGFAKKRVQWLIEHSTSYQHLWFIDESLSASKSASSQI